MKRLRFMLGVVWLAALCGLLSSAQAAQVCVVISERSAAFLEASESLTQTLLRNGMARQDVALMDTLEYREAPASDARLIVSLGTDALREVMGRSGRTSVLAALIPRISFERVLRDANRKGSGAMAALYLDQPFGRQLDLLRLALPGVRRVGVLWGPESISQQELLGAALQARGMQSAAGQLGSGQPLIGALRSAMLDADALLAVADSSVYNPTTVSNILLTTYRAKLPVMAFSPAYVKAGALLSVHSTAAQAGVQSAAMALQYLQTNNLPASQYPSDFTITANEYLARSLGLALDVGALAERLRRLERSERSEKRP